MLTRRRLIVASGVAASVAVAAVVLPRRSDPVADERKRDLLARLARLGPLPDDDAITQGQLSEFFDIVCTVDSDSTPPDPDYIRPILNTFGYGDGFAGYAHGAWALLKQDRDAVVEAALDTLEAGRAGPRQWAMETLRRMREGDRGNPPPSSREVRAAEAALRGPPLTAYSAVYWAYWVDGPVGRRVLELASRVATGEWRARAAELLVE